jgi:hypothetical protein
MPPGPDRTKQGEQALREVLARQDHGYAVPSPSRIPTLREFVKTWKADPKRA